MLFKTMWMENYKLEMNKTIKSKYFNGLGNLCAFNVNISTG